MFLLCHIFMSLNVIIITFRKEGIVSFCGSQFHFFDWIWLNKGTSILQTSVKALCNCLWLWIGIECALRLGWFCRYFRDNSLVFILWLKAQSTMFTMMLLLVWTNVEIRCREMICYLHLLLLTLLRLTSKSSFSSSISALYNSQYHYKQRNM